MTQKYMGFLIAETKIDGIPFVFVRPSQCAGGKMRRIALVDG
jgi:hypothetical protein